MMKPLPLPSWPFSRPVRRQAYPIGIVSVVRKRTGKDVRSTFADGEALRNTVQRRKQTTKDSLLGTAQMTLNQAREEVECGDERLFLIAKR